MNNKYVNRAKISEKKFRDIVRFFSLDLTAIQISELTGLNRNTINRYLTEIRKKIALFSDSSSPFSSHPNAVQEPDDISRCEILIMESGNRIFTELIKASDTGSTTHHEAEFDMRIDLESGKHHYIGKTERNLEAARRTINRIESFWGNARSRLSKFKGIHPSTYKYHLKECEFRYNYRQDDLYQLLLKILRNDPLF